MLQSKQGMEVNFIVRLILLIIFLLAAAALYFVLSGKGEVLLQRFVNII